MSDKFDTSLSPSEEASFREWKAKHAHLEAEVREIAQIAFQNELVTRHRVLKIEKLLGRKMAAMEEKLKEMDVQLKQAEADSRGRQTIKRERARK